MATTTAALIRDRCTTVIEALVPRSVAGAPANRFRRYRTEASDLDAFIDAMEKSPEQAFRQFIVLTADTPEEPEASNHDIETHFVDITVAVAFPRNARAGIASGNPGQERHDLIDQDRHDIEGAIGLRGAANFTPPHPDATWRDGDRYREKHDACEFLVITQRMSFARLMT